MESHLNIVKNKSPDIPKFTPTNWIVEANAFVRLLLCNSYSLNVYMQYIGSGLFDSNLYKNVNFLVEFFKCEKLPMLEGSSVVLTLYKSLLQGDFDGMNYADLDYARNIWTSDVQNCADIDPEYIWNHLYAIADLTLSMLSLETLSHFVSTSKFQDVIEILKADSSSNHELVSSKISNATSQAPIDADEWLNVFVSIIEKYPVSISITV